MKTEISEKHTPGPWSYRGKITWVEDSKNRLIAIAEWKNDQKEYPYTVNEAHAKANARLISAAPDLLEAAKEALRQLGAPDCPVIPDSAMVKGRLCAAIAKAERGAEENYNG